MPYITRCIHWIINPGLPSEVFDAFDSDDEDSERSEPIKDEHHGIFDCSAYADAREQHCDLFQSHINNIGNVYEPASMQQAGQVSPSP